VNTRKEQLEELVTKLKQERDELRVKAHLGTMDAKEEWAELEKKWHRLETEFAESKQDVTEKAQAMQAKAQVVAGELKDAYHRIRERLQEV